MKVCGRPWLLTIHCVSHRLELAIKDSLLKHPEFVSVKDIMITIFYVMKQSGKFKRQFHATAEALGVQVYTFPKVHDTRFVNHQRNGVRMLLHNWIPLMEAVENAVAHEKGKTHSARPAQLEGNVRTRRMKLTMLLAMHIRKRDIDRRVWNVHRRNDLWIDVMTGLCNTDAKHANVSSHVSVCLSEIDAAPHEEINTDKKDNSCRSKQEMIAVTPFTGWQQIQNNLELIRHWRFNRLHDGIP